MTDADGHSTVQAHRALRAELARLRADLAAHRTRSRDEAGLPTALQAEAATLRGRFLVLRRRYQALHDA